MRSMPVGVAGGVPSGVGPFGGVVLLLLGGVVFLLLGGVVSLALMLVRLGRLVRRVRLAQLSSCMCVAFEKFSKMTARKRLVTKKPAITTKRTK